MLDRSRRILLYGLLAILSVAFFAINWVAPPALDLELLQVAIVLLTLFVPGRTVTVLFGAITTIFVGVGYLLQTPPQSSLETTANHGIVLLGLWLAVAVVLAYKHVLQSRRESEARARTILNRTVDGILTIDAEGTIESINPAAEEIFGYDASEVIGTMLANLLAPSDWQALKSALRQYRDEGHSSLIGNDLEMMGHRKNGSSFPLELSISEVEIDDRTILTGIVRDITERKKDERRIRTQYLTAQILTESDSLGEAAPQLLEMICEQLDWEWGELWLPDPNDLELKNAEVWQRGAAEHTGFASSVDDTTFGRGEGLPGVVWQEQRPKWIDNVQHHDAFLRRQEATRADMRAGFAFPIRLGSRVFGVMVFFSGDVREPDESLLQMFSVIGNQLGQFTDRRRTEERLQKTAERLTRAQEVARLGSWEFDLDSDETIWSNQMYRLFGVEQDEFEPTMSSVYTFFPDDDQARFENAFDRIRDGESSFRLEHRVHTDNGSTRWMLTQAQVRDDSRLVGTTLDITELKETKKALEESEARAQAILETTVDGIITIDTEGHIETFNEAAEDIFGYDAAEVIGKNVKTLMPSPYREEHDEYLRSYLDTGHGNIIGVGREVMGQRKDGSTFPMDLAVSEVDFGDRMIFTGIVRDISERRRLEKEILNVSEDERRRIGQDLHDGLGQMLTGIGLLSQDVTRHLEEEEHDRADDMAEITEHIKEADQYARDLSHGLIPVDVEANGLPEALRRLAGNAERLFDVDCAFREIETVRVHDNTTATHLYRIAQEAVNNAVRHGAADELKVILASGDEQIRLQVRDDGSGFDEQDTDEADGMGVHIMNYRARIIGGTLDISSALGEGTVVTCTLPRTSYAVSRGDDAEPAPV